MLQHSNKKPATKKVESTVKSISKQTRLVSRKKIATWKMLLVIIFFVGALSMLVWGSSFFNISLGEQQEIKNSSTHTFLDSEGKVYGPFNSNTVTTTLTNNTAKGLTSSALAATGDAIPANYTGVFQMDIYDTKGNRVAREMVHTNNTQRALSRINKSISAGVYRFVLTVKGYDPSTVENVNVPIQDIKDANWPEFIYAAMGIQTPPPTPPSTPPPSTPPTPPTPTPAPELYVTKSVDKTEASAGDILTYTLSYDNPTSDVAHTVEITDPIPTGTSFVNGSLTGGGIYVPAENSVRWNISEITGGTTGSVTFKVAIDGDAGLVCGNGLCEDGETTATCAVDCPAPPPPPPLPPTSPQASQCPAIDERGGLVILSGSNIPSEFIGQATNSIYGYKYSNGAWQQKSVQVDEIRPAKSPVIGSVYVTESSFNDEVPENDWAGTDTEYGIDNGEYSDEIVFAVSSLGEKAPASATNPDGIEEKRHEVSWKDPVNDTQGYFYLFSTFKTLDTPDEDAVDYEYSVKDCNGYKATCENTTAETACYSTHFSMRWVQDEFKIKTAAGGTNENILDRVMGAAYAKPATGPFRASYGENEDHKMNGKIYCGGWSVYDANHYYLGHIDGPVRAIRQIKGACSFENLVRIWKFAEDHIEESLSVQGHGFKSSSGGFGIRMNYAAGVAPLEYYSSSFPNGLTFDGSPDFSNVNVAQIAPQDLLDGLWGQVSSSNGGLLTHIQQLVPFVDTNKSKVWLYMHDNKSFTDTTTGNGMYGGHGLRLSSFENSESRPILFTQIIRPIEANSENSGESFKQFMDTKPIISISKIN